MESLGAATSEHHPHSRSQRLRHYVHPNGRHIHIAHTPEDHGRLHQELIQEYPEQDFDILIQGTSEHFALIRELHSHHETRRESLRQQHGDLFDQFEAVQEELNHLSQELGKVLLDANFSKFGYSAHLRTKDDSGLSTPTKDDASSIKRHQNRMHEGEKFFKRPVVRQYMHKGLLWRSARSGEVGTFELFTDLLYVGIIGIIGDKAIEKSSGKSLLEYCINFCMAFKIWSDLTLVSNWFERDDILKKISVCFYLVTLFGYTTNIAYAFETDSTHGQWDTYIPMMSFYLINRFFGALYFIWLAFVVPLIRGALLYHSFVAIFAGVLWIASAQVRYPGQLALIWTAIIIDIFGTYGAIWISRVSRREGSRWARFASKYFDFIPAVNIEHRTERTNAFVSLVFGYSVLTILFQSRASIGLNAFFGKGILGLIQAFAFQWLYFEIDHQGVHVHAIRRHWATSITWITTHLPFVLSYVLAAATLSKLVLAHDCENANVEDLGEEYQSQSVATIDNGLRWFYCGGIGMALLTMAVLSFCHVHKKIPGARLMKRHRLVIRVCIAAAIICLPAARRGGNEGDGLSSLQLIAISTSLVVLTLGLDIFGNSFRGCQFWTGGWCDESKRRTSYTAHVAVGKKRKHELIKALHLGEKVRLEELLRKKSSSSSATTSSQSEKDHRAARDEEWQHAHF